MRAPRRRAHARVLRRDDRGRLEVRGPAVRLVELPVGAQSKHGQVTEYTPDWARVSEEKIADDVRLEGARESGHDIEGHVRIGGKRYSAFASGGPDDFVIVVRRYGGETQKRSRGARRRDHATASVPSAFTTLRGTGGSRSAAGTIRVGDIVQRADRDDDKRYVVTDIRAPWIYTRRISGSGAPGIITFPSSLMLRRVG